MNDLNYNASHAADPVSGKAIKAADRQAKKINDLIQGFQLNCRAANVEVYGRIVIKEKDNGRIWR